jgi:hypothetical protein
MNEMETLLLRTLNGFLFENNYNIELGVKG